MAKRAARPLGGTKNGRKRSALSFKKQKSVKKRGLSRTGERNPGTLQTGKRVKRDPPNFASRETRNGQKEAGCLSLDKKRPTRALSASRGKSKKEVRALRKPKWAPGLFSAENEQKSRRVLQDGKPKKGRSEPSAGDLFACELFSDKLFAAERKKETPAVGKARKFAKPARRFCASFPCFG